MMQEPFDTPIHIDSKGRIMYVQYDYTNIVLAKHYNRDWKAVRKDVSYCCSCWQASLS